VGPVRRSLSAALLAVLAGAGCESGPSRTPAQPPPARRTVEEWAPDPAPPGAGAPQADGDEVTVPALAVDPAVAEASPTAEPTAPPRTIAPAAARDTAFDSDDAVPVRRYVYRVRLGIPSALGDDADLATPAAELFIDASTERVRARFVGQGWPVDAGAEVRLRGDSPGVYVFDGSGGRPLLPGELGEWFEGGERRPGPPLSVRRDPTMPTGEATGALVCALLAEWAGEEREGIERRCDGRAPIGFRVGLWRAERTADLQVELPRRSLRADEVDAPDPTLALASRAFFEPASLARLEPPGARGQEVEPRDPSAPGEGLLFVNQSATRVIVTAQGVPLGWVAPASEGYFVGLRPGVHQIGGLRPMGSIALRPRLVELPARTVLRQPRERR
jgi:hypothetical protein